MTNFPKRFENPSQLDRIASFFAEYRTRTSSIHRTFNTSVFMKEFARMRAGYSTLKGQAVERHLREAPDFNIFQILGVARAEVSTHSAFLAHLLSPTASHGQGMLFLKSFLQHCTSRYPDFPFIPPFESPWNWSVVPEEHFHSGRMDIIIINMQEGFLCVIENKVYSEESWEQLERYHGWLEEHARAFPHRALCYLTPTGKSSKTFKGDSYFSLSYHQDIAGWLEDVLDQIQAPEVRAVAHQYQAIATSL